MTIRADSKDNCCTITLDRSFDFESVEDFRNAYVKNSSSRYVIDFRNTEYMDSSGLGMLINMRRDNGDNQANIQLINCRPQIKKVFLISRFDQYFDID